ncbi:Na+/H+ antiporter subunit E [Hydrogenophaga sp. ZJX-1]|uniref:Na+/H+ antiporter subunit E n=1 Tax=Hydrogenophaga sp. ZJX-1 TaxID=3404778 RepID=UPI003B2858C4
MSPMTPTVNKSTKRYPASGWFAHPVLSVLLAASWLALSHSLEWVHLLSAVLIGLIVPRLLRPFLTQASVLHWPTALRLMVVVLWDIVVSNVVVAKLVLGPLDRMQPGWIPVPLACSHHRVNALFASIITTTPGTVSALIDEEQGVILVHALNCDNPATMAAEMKQRYEAPLLRAFHLEPGSPT